MSWAHYLFEREENLDAIYMAARAAMAFFITLVLIRVAGVRLFGRRSSFDIIVIITMGSILARGIVGASSFWATVAASATMILIHRLLGWLSCINEKAERLVKGQATILYRDGNIIKDNLMKTSLSKADLLESLHLEMKKTSLEEVDVAFMETNGRISFILKEGKKE